MKLDFLDRFSKNTQIPNLMKIPSSGKTSFSVRTDTTKLTVAFRNFSECAKKTYLLLCHGWAYRYNDGEWTSLIFQINKCTRDLSFSRRRCCIISFSGKLSRVICKVFSFRNNVLSWPLGSSRTKALLGLLTRRHGIWSWSLEYRHRQKFKSR